MSTSIVLKSSGEYLQLKGNIVELEEKENGKKSIWIIEVVDKIFFCIKNYQNGGV